MTFFGSSHAKPTDPHFIAASQVANLVARSGRRVVNGGGPGIMLAATLGAKDGNGKTTVVYYRPELATTFEGKTALNYADEHFEQSNYILRTKKLLELGDAYIVFNGGTGTISEFAMAWGLSRLYFGHHKPLILYGDFWHYIIEGFKKYMIVQPTELKAFTIVTSPTEALNSIDEFDRVIAKNRHLHPTCNGAECEFIL